MWVCVYKSIFLFNSSSWCQILPLCISVELNLRDRALGEVESNSFIALLG